MSTCICAAAWPAASTRWWHVATCPMAGENGDADSGQYANGGGI